MYNLININNSLINNMNNRIQEINMLLQSIPFVARVTGRNTLRVRVLTGAKENNSDTINKIKNELDNWNKKMAKQERRSATVKQDSLTLLRQKEVETLAKASEMQKRIELLKQKQEDRSIMTTLKAMRLAAAEKAKEEAKNREIETAYLIHKEGIKQEQEELKRQAWQRADARLKEAKVRGATLAQERKEAAQKGISSRIAKVEQQIADLASNLAYLEEQEALALATKKARRG